MRELDSDDAVTILENLDEEDQAEVLDQLPATERVALQRSLDYPEDSAGRRMQTEFIAVPPFWTVGQTIDYMRETPRPARDLLRDLRRRPGRPPPRHGAARQAAALEAPGRRSSEIMIDDPDRVEATDDQEEVARLFERYNLVSAAVVDEGSRLVGVLMIDDIVDVIEEEADDDIKALGGVSRRGDLRRRCSTSRAAASPGSSSTSCTALIASSVIGLFEDSIEKMVALAILMPIVASMGGNAGTQTMTVAVRALATRDLGRANAWRIVRRELMVGVINGVLFAVILGLIAGDLVRHDGHRRRDRACDA